MITLCGFGVSNCYNKLKLILLEKGIPFQERVVYPWQRETFRHCSPLGKIPFIETEEGPLSESQAILEFLEERYPACPLYPVAPFQRAKCREAAERSVIEATGGGMAAGWRYSPNSLNPGCSSGRRPSGQRNLRSASSMDASLMLAWRTAMKPCSSNAQFSLPYERYQLPVSSCHS